MTSKKTVKEIEVLRAVGILLIILAHLPDYICEIDFLRMVSKVCVC